MHVFLVIGEHISSHSHLLERVSEESDGVVAADGRHDSMGHSANYCVYTIFCCNVPMIIHFSIV